MGIFPPTSNIMFAPYESVFDVDPFVNLERLLNVSWMVPYYWHFPVSGRSMSVPVCFLAVYP